MKVIYDLGQRKYHFKNSILAIGVFDGLHVGHRHLIRKVVAKARLLKGTSLVMTFSPHPVHILNPSVKLPLLATLEQRLKLMADFGVDFCIVMRFTKAFSCLSPEGFIHRYLISSTHVREIFVGENFRFGKSRAGDGRFLKRFLNPFKVRVHVVRTLRKGKHIVSSSYIRHLIREGQVGIAGRLLGRYVSCCGRVVRGDGRGRKLGFPTANINPPRQLIPAPGVYQAQAIIGDKTYWGMVNVGYRPSFTKPDIPANIEVHIFDFRKNIYGMTITVQFLKKIRDEKWFPSPEALVNQLKKDQAKIKRLFSKSSKKR